MDFKSFSPPRNRCFYSAGAVDKGDVRGEESKTELWWWWWWWWQQ